MKNNRKNLSDAIPVAVSLARKSGIPIDILGGYPSIKILSGHEIIIEGRCRLLEYSRERICAVCGKMKVAVTGRGLDVRLMDGDALIIIGMITALLFEE